MQELIKDVCSIIELAVTTKIQEKHVNKFCKISLKTFEEKNIFICDNIKTQEAQFDFYRVSDRTSKIIRYRKEYAVGVFYIINDNILIYHHYLRRYHLMSEIKKYLKDGKYNFKYFGDYLFFDINNSLKLKDPIHLCDDTIIVKLPYVQIKNVYVPSDKTTRIFLICNNIIYGENKSRAHSLGYYLYHDILDNNYYDNLDIVPRLFVSNYSHKTLNDVDEEYSKKLLNVLTS